MSELIRLAELKKSFSDGYGGSIDVLRGVNLSVSKGQMVLITGASGSGKSTLLHILGSLDNFDSGCAIIDGLDLALLNEESKVHYRRKVIGFMFQFHHLLSDFSALENVMMPMWIKANRRYDCEDKALKLLDAVNLSHRKNQFPATLSGGEQQRLALARAIANNPQVLLADEPTGNLDDNNSSAICDLLKRLNDEYKLTVIIVSHDKNISWWTDRHLSLSQGVLKAVNG